MKKGLLISIAIVGISIFLIRSVGARNNDPSAQESNVLAVNSPSPILPTATPTQTPVPTATIDYQQTAIVAQSTAMEAVRVNAQITAEYEQRIQEQLQLTAQADREWFAIQSWTQQAAPTVIPLTATQQAVLNTQIPQREMVMLAQLTATYGAPTQMIVMAKAEQAARYSGATAVVSIIGLVSISLFCLVLAVFLIFKMRRDTVAIEEDTDDDEQPEPAETVIQLKRDNGPGMGSTTRLVVPCKPEQLTELAELAVNGERTFAINRLENSSRTLRRETLYAFRNWAVSNGFAFHPKPGSQEIAVNDDGLCFLEGWFENHQLPDSYKFEEGEELEPA